MSKENRINHYQDNYLTQFGFETEMVKYRRKLVLERIGVNKPRIVVEVGCGSDLLYEHYLEAGGEVDHWIIVEPGSKFHQIASEKGLPNLVAINAFFEDSIPMLKEHLPRPPDMIIISGVLHEVEHPVKLLEAAKSIMDENSVLHANVPNATSFHRELAKSMGLIADTREMSGRNVKFMHYRVHDQHNLRAEIEAAGLAPFHEGGYFIKPFTHAQMESVAKIVGDKVLDGLYVMGKEMPHLASEIYIEARRS